MDGYDYDDDFYEYEFEGKLKNEPWNYHEMRELYPEKFELAVLDEVFLSFYQVAKDYIDIVNLNESTHREEVLFQHSRHWYKSIYSVRHCITLEGVEKRLHIKLPNNGFLYPCPKELKIFKSPEYPESLEIVKLDQDHISQFPSLVSFAKLFLSTSEVFCKLFYNWRSDVFEFIAFSDKNRHEGVCFSYRCIKPIDHEFDNDYWLKA